MTQGYYLEPKNPAAGRTIVSKQQKLKTAYSIFELDELKKIFAVDFPKDPDYQLCRNLALYTGCRLNEVTSLQAEQFFTSANGVLYFKLTDAKTVAGYRSIPLPDFLGMQEFIQGKKGHLFKYINRDGKGSGNAVSQKFKRQMADLGIAREKLVFHSLRKFLNNYLKSNDIGLEVRCQLVGHEINNVNALFYTKVFTVDKLAEKIFPILEQLRKEIGHHKKIFN